MSEYKTTVSIEQLISCFPREAINYIEQLQTERDALKAEVAMRKDIAEKRFNEGLRQGQANMKNAIADVSKAKEEYFSENERLTNLLLQAESERDALKARIDGGIRGHIRETDYAHWKKFVDYLDWFNASFPVNSTLIIDEGVDL